MPMSRRALLGWAGVAPLGLLVGCGSRTDQVAADRMNWLRGLPGVERVELVRPPGYRLIENLRLTLTPDLPDADITGLAETVVADFDQYAEGFTEVVELDFDHCLARFDPLATEADLLDVDRGLWVRSDRRATAMRYGERDRIIITAPRASVLAVALDYDDAHPADPVRRRHRIETESRDLAVEWQRSDREELDHSAVRQVADLQDSQPGLTGWIDGRRGTAGLYFDPADIDLDTVRTGLDSLLDPGLFRSIDLGWGVARARQEIFADGFGGPLRKVLTTLAPVDGVSEVRLNRRKGQPALDVITVRTGEGLTGAVDALAQVTDADVEIRQIREPALEVGEDGPETYLTSSQAPSEELDFLTTIADLTGVTQIELGDDFGQAYFDPEVSDSDLDTTLAGLRTLPRLATIELLTRVLHSSSFAAAARIEGGKFSDERNKHWPIPVSDELVDRMEQSWQRVSG